jgi:hypothetical protein
MHLETTQAAYARRGAPWTFDAQAFVDAVRLIKQQGRATLPSFDHGVGDPVEGDILIDAAQHSVVLVSSRLVRRRSIWCLYGGWSAAVSAAPWHVQKEYAASCALVHADG